MKFIMLTALLLSLASLTQAQENKAIKKPQRVFILNDSSIVTEKDVNEIAQSGYVKNVVTGATNEERQSYQAKFGNVIGDNFIARIYTLTAEEKKKKEEGGDIIKVKQPITAKEVSRSIPALKVGDMSRDFEVELIDGTHVKLSDLKGKVVLLNFWAT